MRVRGKRLYRREEEEEGHGRRTPPWTFPDFKKLTVDTKLSREQNRSNRRKSSSVGAEYASKRLLSESREPKALTRRRMKSPMVHLSPTSTRAASSSFSRRTKSTRGDLHSPLNASTRARKTSPIRELSGRMCRMSTESSCRSDGGESPAPTLRQSASPTFAPSRTPTFSTTSDRDTTPRPGYHYHRQMRSSRGLSLFSQSLSSDDEADGAFRATVERLKLERENHRRRRQQDETRQPALKEAKASSPPPTHRSGGPSYKKFRPTSLAVNTACEKRSSSSGGSGVVDPNRSSIDLSSSGTFAGHDWKIGPSGIASTPSHFKQTLSTIKDGEVRSSSKRRKSPHSSRRRGSSSANMACEFVIIEEIGRGNSGVVYKAVHLPTLHLVALKRMRMQPRQRREIIQELQSLYSNLVPLESFAVSEDTKEIARRTPKCPEIVAFHGAFTSAEEMSMSLVLEHMDAGSLQDFVSSGRRLSESTLANVAATILRGLKFIHERRQIHRDIKPGNILLNSKGEVKIADFGIAKNFDTLNLSRADTFTGTMIYMAPERLEGKPYTYAADIWSFGLTIFTLARAKFPFSASGGFWELTQIIRDRPVPTLSTSEFSSSLVDFCAKCMAKSASDRPSARELLRHPFLARSERKGLDRRDDDERSKMLSTLRPRRDSEREAANIAKRVAKHYRRIFKSQQKRKQRRAMSAPSASLTASLDDRRVERPQHSRRADRRSSLLPRLVEAVPSPSDTRGGSYQYIRSRVPKGGGGLVVSPAVAAKESSADIDPMMRPSDDAVRHLADQLGVRSIHIQNLFNERLGTPLSSSRRRHRHGNRHRHDRRRRHHASRSRHECDDDGEVGASALLDTAAGVCLPKI